MIRIEIVDAVNAAEARPFHKMLTEDASTQRQEIACMLAYVNTRPQADDTENVYPIKLFPVSDFQRKTIVSICAENGITVSKGALG